MRVLTEERILGAVDHPFLARLYGTIQTDTHLHFLMQVRLGQQRPAAAVPCSRLVFCPILRTQPAMSWLVASPQVYHEPM